MSDRLQNGPIAKSKVSVSSIAEAAQKSISPLLKWPGGKRALASSILPFIPKSSGRYFEPFVGGGALFFALSPASATLSDTNVDLIETYKIVRNRPRDLIRILRTMRNSEKQYYKIRAERPESPVQRAARFIYLCTLSFNGIHRYNLKGDFNVPYGFKTHLEVCDDQRILACSAKLKQSRLISGDFEAVVDKARKGDLIYLDPPYTVAHNNNGFVKYNASIFSWKDQERLAAAANSARERGCYVIVSNADHSCVKALYRKFNVETITRPSVIASSSEFRKTITESLFWSHPK